MTAIDPHAAAARALSAADPRLAELIARVGPCRLAVYDARADLFTGLVQAIVSQQLSGKAAETIFGRVKLLAPAFDAPTLLAVAEPKLREAGLSGAKARYVRGLCDAVTTRAIDLAALGGMDDEAVIEALCALKGVGRWTAEMILMFQLGRTDVLPVDDLGIKKGFMRLHRLRKLPDAKRMTKLAAAWRPHRSIASWYLWRLTELAP
jgi:3-methyladenine DNA glycosylase/8-oxoguanine DNA glycosylase